MSARKGWLSNHLIFRIIIGFTCCFLFQPLHQCFHTLKQLRIFRNFISLKNDEQFHPQFPGEGMLLQHVFGKPERFLHHPAHAVSFHCRRKMTFTHRKSRKHIDSGIIGAFGCRFSNTKHHTKGKQGKALARCEERSNGLAAFQPFVLSQSISPFLLHAVLLKPGCTNLRAEKSPPFPEGAVS